jgi:alpha-galactosidase
MMFSFPAKFTHLQSGGKSFLRAVCSTCPVFFCVLGWLATARPAFAALPVGWTNEDIGSPPVTGSALYGNGDWTNSGSGSGIGGIGVGGTSDQFNFTQTSLSGDGDIVALVLSLTGTNANAQAGVMMRNDSTPGSPEASVVFTQNNTISFRYRTGVGAGTTLASVSGVSAPVFVRLSCSNNYYTAAYSVSGTSWTQVGSTQAIPLASPTLAGLAVSAGTNTATSSTGAFSSVLVVNGPQIGVPAGLTNSYIQSAPFVWETTWPLPQINCGSNALTPRMGWNSWFTVGDAIGPSQTLIEEVANSFVTNGLINAGYQYVVIDCTWIASGRGSRGVNGVLTVDPTRWPSGMQAVANYVHSKGLLMGGYTDIGASGYGSPAQIGAYKYYQQDADQFASWGWDFIKIDDHGPGDFYAAAQAIASNDSGRPIALSLSTPQVDGLQFASRVANSFRVNNDIAGVFANVTWSGILTEFDSDEADWYAQAPGHWNDPDMLVTGMVGISDTEGRSQFNMWSILGAPLMLGTDPRTVTNGAAAFPPTITPTTLATITNAEVIAVDQDPLGAVGRPVAGGTSVYAKPLGSYTSGQYAVLLLNLASSNAAITVNWGDLGLVPGSSATVRDLWAHANLGSITGSYTSPVLASHASMMLTVTGTFNWNNSRVYEAPSGYNTLTGTAYYVPHAPTFSATAYVTGVGQGAANALQFNLVTVPSNGVYQVDIYYACGTNETAALSVNGGAVTNLSFPATGGNIQPGVIYTYLALNAGENTLNFSNPTGPAPNFDSIVLDTGTPSGLAAVAGDGQVSLTWSVEPGASSYNVYRATSSGGEGATPLATGVVTAAYTDSSVTNGVTYYYTVTSTNPVVGAESPQSAEVSAHPRCATSSTAYQTAVLAASPYVYWPLNETNDTVVHDYLNNYSGAYGNLVGLGVPGPRPADFLGFQITNTAAQFTNNATTSWATVPALNLNASTVTITAWIYPTNNPVAYAGIFFCRSGSTVAGMNYSSAGSIGYTWNNNSGTWGWNSGLVPPLNQWSFVALVIQSGSGTIYLENVGGLQTAVNNVANPTQAFAGISTIGTDTYSSAARVFSGRLDEIAIFKSALSSTQVQQLYANGAQLSQVQMGLQWSGGNLNLSWPQGTLFQSANVTGPWVRATNALSPYLVPSNAPTEFFRVLLQQ